jgi:flagellar basal-body rod modification protein FlgD
VRVDGIGDALKNIFKDEEENNKGKDLGKELGRDDFLKLLITQLKYQNPLEPIKDREFISQMAQFSSLEQMHNLSSAFSSFANEQVNLNDIITEMTDKLSKTINKLIANLERLQILPILGKEIDAQDEDGFISGRVERISFRDGLPKLYVSGRELSLDSVLEVMA